MSSRQFASVYRQVGRLFHSGTNTGLTEVQLLDRFVTNQDDSAFESIVARHGPMVMGVCRGLLRDPNDVDDAFQATFLVLVKKASGLTQRDLLGNWLYGVAYRIATRSRSESVRRSRIESYQHELVDPVSDDSALIDLRPILHDELNRLPASYRAAVVLCLLEGQTHEAAAEQLGWPLGTVKGRLARAKDLLRSRLTRRGLSTTPALLLKTLIKAGHVAVAPPLVHSTTKAAISLLSVTSMSALAVSPQVLTLIAGALNTMSTLSIKLAATTFVAGMITLSVASGYQNGDKKVAPETKPATITRSISVSPTPTQEAGSSLEARLKLAENVLSQLTTANAMDPVRSLWDARLVMIRAEQQEMLRAQEGPDYEVKSAERALELAKRREIGIRPEVEKPGPRIVPRTFALEEATYSRMEAEDNLAFVKARRASAGPADKPNPGRPDSRTDAPLAQSSGIVPTNPKTRIILPADLGRNMKIEAALEKIVPMPFATAIPLEDVLKHIKQATADRKGTTIPIYIDRVGLQDADQTMTSPVKIELDGLPLRTTLRLVLKQLKLDYRVQDGLLKIDSIDRLNEAENPAPLDPNARMGGGFGGAGGGGLGGFR